MGTPLSKDDIFRVLASRYQDKEPKILKEIAYNLSLASITRSSLEERAARALQQIQSAPVDYGVLRQAASKSVQNKLSICPICKMGMKIVKLMEDRSAYYCPDHRITVPFPIEEEDE